eukprot:2680246-Rhodomonas_salina.2
MDEMIFLSIDPAACGPQSDYCVISFVLQQGCVKVRPSAHEILPPEGAHQVQWSVKFRLQPPVEYILIQGLVESACLVLVQRARAEGQCGALQDFSP